MYCEDSYISSYYSHFLCVFSTFLSPLFSNFCNVTIYKCKHFLIMQNSIILLLSVQNHH